MSKFALALFALSAFSANVFAATPSSECPKGAPQFNSGPQICTPSLELGEDQFDAAPGVGGAPPPNFAAPMPGGASKIAPNILFQFAKRSKIGITEVLALKVVYDVKGKSGRKVHFVNTNIYPLHFDYVTSEIGYPKGQEAFNKNYSGPLSAREYALVTLVLVKNSSTNQFDRVLMEPWSGDNLDPDGYRKLISDIQAEIPQAMKLIIHPLSTDQEKLITGNFATSEYILTEALYADIPYLALNTGVALGYLRFAKVDPATGEAEALDLRDIAVFDRVPNEIGLVGGVITAEPQTPLSHVNVKSMNRGTANMFLANAKDVLKAYEGKPVELKVDGDQYTIKELNPAQADALIAQFWKKKKPVLNGQLQSILDPAYDHQLVRLDQYFQKMPKRIDHQRLVRMVGAKAANLALLKRISAGLNDVEIEVPGALAIPFNFYEKFINEKQKGLDESNPAREMSVQERVVELLKAADLLNPNKLHPIAIVRPTLEKVRAVVAGAHVPDELIELLRKSILEDETSPIHISKHPRIRLRSSTNSEDLEGFTGAGLYDSDGVDLYKKKKKYDRNDPKKWDKIEEDLRETIARLYSSVWNERAFLEREWYSMNGLKHLDVKAGLAIHGAFSKIHFDGEPGEVANGVAVTTNIYDPGEDGKIYLNAQHYDLAVTNPPTTEELEEVKEDPSVPYVTEEILVTSYLSDFNESNKPGAWKKWSYERLRTTSVRGGESVLKPAAESISGQDEIRTLARALDYIHGRMARVYGKQFYDFAIDVEWKLYGPQRKIIIKQARPFESSKP